MPETQQMTFDEAGVTRTPTGTIADLSPTSTPPSTPEPETIVRPPATPGSQTQPPTTTPSKETKAAETKADGTKADGKDTAKSTTEAPKSLLNEKGAPEGAPEKYADFKVPEGFVLDKDVATEFGTVAKGLNISQAGAQELVDLYVKHAQEAQNAPYQAWTEVQERWRNEINNDPDIGGSKLNGVRASIGKLFDSLGEKVSDPFRAAMDYTGAGNNPDVVRWLNVVAKRLTEGGPVRGGGPSTEGQLAPGAGRPSAAQAIYPNLPSNR